MKLLNHAEIFSTVNKKKDLLVSETVFVGRYLEAKTSLVVECESFLIREAFWEIQKAPAGIELGYGSTEILNGIEAHIEGKRQIKQLTSLKGGQILYRLFTDCFKALIQAETFVWKERGFQSEQDYDQYWEKVEKNGCRAYTYPDGSDLPWMQYAAKKTRQDNLFNRCRHYMLIGLKDGKTEAIGGFHDSFHELGAKIVLEGQEYIISGCDIDFGRAPAKACFENSMHAEKFVGMNLRTLEKKEIIDHAGRSSGCYHLVDLIDELSAIASGKGIFSNNIV